MKTLKLFNGGDWNYQGGHLYVAAFSQNDACTLANEAYRKIHNMPDRLDYNWISIGYFRTYWNSGHWGICMNNVTPERGVWWSQNYGNTEQPERII